MSWIAISCNDVGSLPAPGWIDPDARQAIAPKGTGQSGWLKRGTLMIEVDASAPVRAETLFAFRYDTPNRGQFRLRLLPGGDIELLQEHDGMRRHHRLGPIALDYPERLRISYSWDVPGRCMRLAVELPEGSDAALVLRAEAPLPMPTDALLGLVPAPRKGTLSEAVDFFAISGAVEDLGPSPGLRAGSPVATPEGLRPVESFRPGDRVLMDDGTEQPVLARVCRRLPARGLFRPVQLHAPYFGLQEDIVLSGGQCIEMRGADIEYLFYSEKVLVPARFLVAGSQAGQGVFLSEGALADWHQLVLPRPGRLRVAGVPMEGLHIGPPEDGQHAGPGTDLLPLSFTRRPEFQPVLRAFEALTLAVSRRA